MPVGDFVGVALSKFRSYGPDLQVVGPWTKVHLLAGKNNVGKSNALRFVRLLVEETFGGRHTEPNASRFITDQDIPEGFPLDFNFHFALGFRRAALQDLLQIDDDLAHQAFDALFDTEAFSFGSKDVVWFRMDFVRDQDNIRYRILLSSEQLDLAFDQGADAGAITALASFRRISTNGLLQSYRGLVNPVDLWTLVPPFQWIEAKREVGADDSLRAGDELEAGWRHGRGVISLLARLQSPETVDRKRDRPKFDALQNFVRAVLDDPRAIIAIPASQNDLQVETGGRLQSFRNLGTGITEIIHIAAVATAHSGHVIAIEEPEVHLHPTLQRQLIAFLASETDNQYLITTHSSSFLDAERASVSHVRLNEQGWSQTNNVLLELDRSRLVADLGSRASDIVQSNYLVWVEGPSDRIYVSAWLAHHDPELVEGAHFSIMFYGGALLSHLTASDDPELARFINLLQINRNMTIVIDSDITATRSEVNATKARVIREVTFAGASAWVTDGYTIENYIQTALLQDVVDKLYPGKQYDVPADSFASPLGQAFSGLSAQPSKVAVARAVVSEVGVFDKMPEQLSNHVAELSKRIRAANGLPPRSAAGIA